MAKDWVTKNSVKKTTPKPSKEANKAHKLRKANQDYYDSHNVEPTEIDGQVFRSRLEALWFEELSGCDSFECFECFQVPVWIQGPFGKFLSNYKPDLVLETEAGRIFVELKPNHELAMADDRQKRALELNPRYKFVVIGGYPYSQRGVTIRMITSKGESINKNVKVPDVLAFLGCGANDPESI